MTVNFPLICKLPPNQDWQLPITVTVDFSIKDIAKILQNLNPGRAHGHDKISIRILQLCGNTI